MRLKVGLPLLALLLLAAALASLFQTNTYAAERPLWEEDTDTLYFYVNRWQVHWGDTPPDPSDWKPFNAAAQRQMVHYKGNLWLRRVLPPLPERDPYLFLFGFKQFEVTIDGRKVYSFNMDGRRERIHILTPVYPIRLNPEDAGKLVEIQLYWNHAYLQIGWNGIGSRYQVLLNVLYSEWPYFIYAALFTSAGLISAVLYLRRRKESMYIWFSLLALSAGIGIGGKMALLQWLIEVNSFYYWKDLLLAVGIYAFVGFYGEALRSSDSWIYRSMKGILLAYTLFTAVAGWWSGLLFWRLMVDWLPYCCVPVLLVVSISLIRQFREKRSRETVWLMRAYSVLLVTGLIYILLNFAPSLIERIISISPHMQWVVFHELPFGLLLAMLCLAMVLFHRFTEVYRQVERNTVELAAKNGELERFHRSLENLVDIRTQELEAANRSLEASMREKAETLAEVSVLEERNRIAHEIHDVVGHTLTAAIVQLEASKKLAGRDLAKAAEKLDVINGLVRKGLDDIRRSVRLLKDEGEPFDLHAALDELIRDTEQTMGVDIDARIEPIDHLGWLTQRVIYHALQEGLTNGIRHGSSSHFTFNLYRDGPLLRFILHNNGEPFGLAKPGFGLSTMMERIHLLGGTVEVGSSSGNDSTGISSDQETGCRLEITLPIA